MFEYQYVKGRNLRRNLSFIFLNVLYFRNMEKIPLENPLEKSDDHVAPLCVFLPGWPSSSQTQKNKVSRNEFEANFL